MSNFEAAIPVVLAHEGFYVNDPYDQGGATNFGISLRWLQTIDPIDADIDHDGDINIEDIKKLKKTDAIKLYKEYWWDKNGYERITDSTIATKVFDLAVNMGSVQSHKCLQRAIRSANDNQYVLEDDGILGSKTIGWVNRCTTAILLAAFRSEAAGYYRSLNKPRFINGWLNRAYS